MLTSSPAESTSAPEVVVEEPAPDSRPSSAPFEFEAETKKWRRWWWIPLTVGIVITVVSGLLMFLAYQRNRFWFLVCLPVVPLTVWRYYSQPGCRQPGDALAARQSPPGTGCATSDDRHQHAHSGPLCCLGTAHF